MSNQITFRGGLSLYDRSGSGSSTLTTNNPQFDFVKPLSAPSITITGAPTAETDVATKGYVDGQLLALSWRTPVRVRADVNIDLANPIPALIDGVNDLTDGDRVLLTNQTDGVENGIYDVNALNRLVRSADLISAGMIVPVHEGILHADHSYVLTNDNPIVVDTDVLVFALAFRHGLRRLQDNNNTAHSLEIATSVATHTVSDTVVWTQTGGETKLYDSTGTGSIALQVDASGNGTISSSGGTLDMSLSGQKKLTITGAQMTYGGDYAQDFILACQARAGQSALLVTETAPAGGDRLQVGSIGTYNIIDSASALTIKSQADGIVLAAQGGAAVNIQGHQLVRFGVGNPNVNVGEFNSAGLSMFGGYNVSVPQDPTVANHLCRKAYVDAQLAGQLLKITGSTYGSLQEMQDLFHSAGIVDGMVISANGTNIDISSGNFLIRPSASATANLYHGTYSGVINQAIGVSDALRYVVLTWVNATTEPSLSFEANKPNELNAFTLGTVYNETGVGLHITSTYRHQVGDHAGQMIERQLATMTFMRTSGLDIGTSGLNITLSTGVVWVGLSEQIRSSYDSSITQFAYFHRNGAGGWTRVLSNSINNTQYDDGSGTLATLANGRYGVHWVYQGNDGDVYVIYGRGSFQLVDAEAEGQYSDLPGHFPKHALLVAKLIIAKSNTVIDYAFSAFTTVVDYNTTNSASGISFDNTASGMTATDVQGAIDEVEAIYGSNSIIQSNDSDLVLNADKTALNANLEMFVDSKQVFGASSTITLIYANDVAKIDVQTDVKFICDALPAVDNTYTLGNGTYFWQEIFCRNATINTSDIGLKTNVRSIEWPLEIIRKLRPVWYKWIEKSHGRDHCGFIAQEVKEALEDPSGTAMWVKHPETGREGLRYAEFIALSIAGIKDIDLRVSALENRKTDHDESELDGGYSSQTSARLEMLEDEVHQLKKALRRVNRLLEKLQQ